MLIVLPALWFWEENIQPLELYKKEWLHGVKDSFYRSINWWEH